ncbi:uncharacterized protein BKA78DRAFT_60724 [Phyllosticta capitalensis]|uniref:uncharacterized protein n=1 Tax=Phyllosticta capitalensis TaxID=121624 RepID=UPI0031315BC6
MQQKKGGSWVYREQLRSQGAEDVFFFATAPLRGMTRPGTWGSVLAHRWPFLYGVFRQLALCPSTPTRHGSGASSRLCSRAAACARCRRHELFDDLKRHGQGKGGPAKGTQTRTSMQEADEQNAGRQRGMLAPASPQLSDETPGACQCKLLGR